MRKNSGFSLIELLIVVAIILVIAAIAIPSLLRAHIAANESAAVASIRTLNTAEIAYSSTYPTVGFASTLTSLGPTSATSCATPNSTHACLIDNNLATATTGLGRNGYLFDVATFSTNTGYAVAGTAVNWNQTGIKSFCSVGDAVVRYKVETATIPASTYTSSTAACNALAPIQ